MKTTDIIILSNATPKDNKLFKKCLVNNGFRDIPHKILSFSASISDLESYSPKLVISMGEDVITKFNLSESNLHNIAGKCINSHNLKIFCTYSIEDVVNENDYIYSYIYDHIKMVSDLYFKSRNQTKPNVSKIDQTKVVNKCHSFKLPDWCYDENHILIDIQHNNYKNQLVFIFRDKDGNKKFHYENSKKRYFYVYPQNIKDSDVLMNISDVELHFSSVGLLDDCAIYDGDVNPEVKHSIDYYYNRNCPEPNYELKKLYWDIEVYTGHHKAFPFPLEAEHPINSISFKLDLTGQTHVYILNYNGMDLSSYTDNKIEPNDCKKIESLLKLQPDISKYEIRIFNSEKELIESFIHKVSELDPDILAGWNTDFFDIPYLFNRMYKLGIDPDTFSPIHETDINISEYKESFIYGLYFADQLVLYQKLTQNKEESYKLSTISQKILGSDKVAYEGTINNMYEGDLVKFILYSGTDTDLLAELEEALNHIKLNFDIIKTCSTTWLRAETTTGMVDPLLLKFAKDKNKVCRNKIKNHREAFSGAYVLDPKVGLHKYVVDFDFKSLYPSIIRSFNLGPNTYKAKIEDYIAEAYLYNFKSLPSEIAVKINPMKRSYHIVNMTPNELKDFIEKNNYIVTINGCMLEQHDVELSFFYEVLTYLGDERDRVKKMLGDARQKYNNDKSLTDSEKLEVKIAMNQYDNRQSTYKILANSLYGIIAQPFFRMFNIDIAKAVTSTGQEALKFSVLHLSTYMATDELDVNVNFLKDFENSSLPYIAYGDSVGKDSIINMESSNDTIENIWNNADSDIIYSIDGKERKMVNLSVLTSDQKHTNKFSQCTSIVRHKVDKKVFRVQLSNETYIDVTEDHSLITLDDNLDYNETKPQDSKYILLNKFIPRAKTSIQSKNYIKEVYELFGFWIGDGSYNSLTKNDYICISSGLDTDEFCNKVLNILKDNNIISNYYISKNKYDIKILSKKFTTMMRELNFTGNSKSKRVPEWIFNETEDNICSFLRGYFSADGTGKSNNILLSSINKDLLNDIQTLLKYCKISSRLLKGNTGNTYNNGNMNSYSYQLKVYDESTFYKKIGFIFSRKISRPNDPDIIVKKDIRDKYRITKKMKTFKSEFVNLSKIQKFISDIEHITSINFDVNPKRINKIYEIEYSDYVYDLTIPETQRFFANDILVHNTDSMFVLLGDYLKTNKVI